MPLWFKVLYGLFLCVLVSEYWYNFGPIQFLWGSDIALFAVFAAVWMENPLPNSMPIH
jgi:hypothetical protein